MKSQKTKPIRIDPELHKRVRVYAAQTGETMQGVIEACILASFPWPRPAKFNGKAAK
jgi:hypothetical protein